MTEQSALAELAEQIGSLGKLYYSAGVIQTDELTPRDYTVIDKAQRIVTELSKCYQAYKDDYGSKGYYIACSDAFENCVMIAEEGDEDDSKNDRKTRQKTQTIR